MTSSADLPHRPRLASHVLARLLRDDEGERVALVHQDTGRVWTLGLREWALLLTADGTRDLDGILLAGAARGAVARPEALREFLGELAAAGLLDDGPVVVRASDAAGDDARQRPLDPLPGYRFACDSRGPCCRQYATVLFSELEAQRARVHLPLVEGGGDVFDRVFTPRGGTGASPGFSVKLVGGACAYLDGHNRCGIHAAAGADAKPFGCGLFPTHFVDDGEAVRVSPLVECACVTRDDLAPDEGDPLVPPDARTRGALHPMVFVHTVDAEVALRADLTVARPRYVAWSRAAARCEPGDVVAWLWWAAEAIDATGELPPPDATPELDPAALVPWLRGLGEMLTLAAERAAQWRTGGDHVLAVTGLLRDVVLLLASDPELVATALEAGPARPSGEALYLRAHAHGHQWVGAAPLVERLRNMALRALAARAATRLLDADALPGVALSDPLTAFEAVARGYGLFVREPR